MRLLVITQYFAPENFRVNDLVSALVQRGHDVTVLTGQPNYPSGDFFDGYGWFGPWRQSEFGAEVLRVPLIRRKAAGSFRLIANYLSFAFTALLRIFFLQPKRGGFDAIFVFAPSPMTVGIPGAFARRRFRAPLLLWVLDLWPESIEAVGAVRSRWALKLVEAMVRWIYGRSDLILVQSQGFIEAVKQLGAPERKIRYFPNWGEAVFEAPQPASPSTPQPAFPEGFKVLFAGNIGAAQDFPSILEAATNLKHRDDIKWLIFGDGRMASWAREEVHRRGLDQTVLFYGQQPLEMMPLVFAEADVLLVSLRADPLFSRTVPGKLQSYLASGKPVMAMLDGEGARVVREANAGFVCAPTEGAELAKQVERMAGLPAGELAGMGQNARRYFETNFARDLVLGRLEEWFHELRP